MDLLSIPSFHPLPLTKSLRLHYLDPTAAARQSGSAPRSLGISPARERAEVEATSGIHPTKSVTSATEGLLGLGGRSGGSDCASGCLGYRVLRPSHVIVLSRGSAARAGAARNRGSWLPPPQVRPSPCQPSPFFSELLLSSSPSRCSESPARVQCLFCGSEPAVAILSPVGVAGGSGAIVLATEGMFLLGPRGAPRRSCP